MGKPLRLIIRFSSGVTRYTYTDRLPSALLSPSAIGAGPQLPFPNDPSFLIAVEDINWDSRGPALSGIVGQEAYGAGAGAEYALLAETYGSSVADLSKVEALFV